MGSIESNEYWGNQLPRLINHGIGGRLNLRSVKLFADGAFVHRLITGTLKLPAGALGSFGAALLEPVRVSALTFATD